MKTKHLILSAFALSMIIAIYLLATSSPQNDNQKVTGDEKSSYVDSPDVKPRPLAVIEDVPPLEVPAPAPIAEEPNTHLLPEDYVNAIPLAGNVPDRDYYDKVGGYTNSPGLSPNRKMILLGKEKNAFYYITDANDTEKMIVKLPSFFPRSCLIDWQWLDNNRVLGSYGSEEFIDEMPFWTKLCVYDIPTKQLFRLELPDEYDGSFFANVLLSGEVHLSGFKGRWTGTESNPVPEKLKSDEWMWFEVPPTPGTK